MEKGENKGFILNRQECPPILTRQEFEPFDCAQDERALGQVRERGTRVRKGRGARGFLI